MNRKQQIDSIKNYLNKFYDTKNITITELNVEDKITEITASINAPNIESRKAIIEIEYAELEEKRK